MAEIEVFKTQDYSIFKRLKGNRDIKCVKKIIESINRVGYIPNPIMVNEDMEVIDGQNRLRALEELELPVYYFIIKGADIETARSLNLGRTNWKPIDYVQSYAESGMKSYQLLLKLFNNNKWMTLQEIYGLNENIIMQSGWAANNLNEGDFKMSNADYCRVQRIIDDLEKMSGSIKQMKGPDRLIKTALAWCFNVDGCDKKRLIAKFNSSYPKIRPVVEIEDFLRDITKLYNSNLAKEKRIDFDVIYRNL